jgi:hypothetical protein
MHWPLLSEHGPTCSPPVVMIVDMRVVGTTVSVVVGGCWLDCVFAADAKLVKRKREELDDGSSLLLLTDLSVTRSATPCEKASINWEFLGCRIAFKTGQSSHAGRSNQLTPWSQSA